MMEAVKAASIFRQYGKERAGDDMYGSGENGDPVYQRDRAEGFH